MSRKNKSRTQQPVVAGVSEPAFSARSRPPSTRGISQVQNRTWLESIAIGVSKALGSLQVAVVLLSTFVIVLIIGTMLESWYSAALAQELVYRAWWFSLLLMLLGVNIFFAAVKKWPWKKHQTGFLITHVGLLTMLTGGIITSLSNTDATIALIDTSNPSVLADRRITEGLGTMRQTGSTILLTDSSQIVLKEYKLDSDRQPYVAKEAAGKFTAGSFTWKNEPDSYGYPHMEPLVAVMGLLANPLPKSWELALGDGAKLKMIAFYPSVRPKKPTTTPNDDVHAGMGKKVEYEPDLSIPPGITRDGLKPAARCRISIGKDSADFWLPQNGTATQQVGDRFFVVEYNQQVSKLPFELKLLRAEATTDKGTQSQASYTSWVQLTDKDYGLVEKDHMITMNEPLEYGGFKIYQSQYGSITQTFGITDPGNDRPISWSGFTVGRDPGLWLKYLGSIMLALGISCMFYMRAYFFQPRVKHSASPNAATNGQADVAAKAQ